jgi:hypothetical protein
MKNKCLIGKLIDIGFTSTGRHTHLVSLVRTKDSKWEILVGRKSYCGKRLVATDLLDVHSLLTSKLTLPCIHCLRAADGEARTFLRV